MYACLCASLCHSVCVCVWVNVIVSVASAAAGLNSLNPRCCVAASKGRLIVAALLLLSSSYILSYLMKFRIVILISNHVLSLVLEKSILNWRISLCVTQFTCSRRTPSSSLSPCKPFFITQSSHTHVHALLILRTHWEPHNLLAASALTLTTTTFQADSSSDCRRAHVIDR